MKKESFKRSQRGSGGGSAHIPYYTRKEAERGFSAGYRGMGEAGDACLPYPMCGDVPAQRCVSGGVERPQGGRGVDHLAKVQQNKAQTETHFFRTPGAIVTLQVSSANYNF